MDKEYHKRKSSEHYQKNKTVYIKNSYSRRRKVKERLVKYLGGKCYLCEYDKCTHALEFHHLDPTLKESILGRLIGEASWDTIQKEAEKCVLLCANCHREVEYGITKLGLVANVGLAADF